MTSSFDEAIYGFKALCTQLTDPEDRKWVDLFMQIDEALRKITAAPIVRNDPVAVEIIDDFAKCGTMEDLARQVDVLSHHIAARTGNTTRPSRRSGLHAFETGDANLTTPMIFKL